jgi:hypothetical protein
VRLRKTLHFKVVLTITCAIILLYARPAPAINCDTDCWATCRACTKIFRRMVCTPPEPVCYSSCLPVKALDCGRQATIRNQPLHGVYCGYGNKDASYQTPGVDALDEACKRHDQCWDSRHQLSCICDRTLAAEALAVSAQGDVPAAVREKAGTVASFFASTGCIPP